MHVKVPSETCFDKRHTAHGDAVFDRLQLAIRLSLMITAAQEGLPAHCD